MLSDLASIKEGEDVFPENNPFGYYLVKTAEKAGATARELEENPNDVISVVKEEKEKYGSIVKEALAYYIADLRRRQEIILGEELVEGNKRISSPYETEIGTAENMKQSIDE
jgi:hypothetical protein